MPAEPFTRSFQPTVPDDLNDPPRFGQIIETTKDALVLELRKFFANAAQTPSRRTELPTIEKYANVPDPNDRFSTSVTILRKLPERSESFPHVAVMASSGTERRLSIGPPFITTVQEPAYIQALEAEPYALLDGSHLVIRTLPNGRDEYFDVLQFSANRFPTANPISAALASDVARVINDNAQHVTARSVIVDGLAYLRIEAGGPASRLRTPTEIEVSPTSDGAELILSLARRGTVDLFGGTAPTISLDAPEETWSEEDIGKYIYLSGNDAPYFNGGRFLIIGFSTNSGVDTLLITNKYARETASTTTTWFIGQRDDHRNPAHPPKHRYAMATDINVAIDVFCDDENTRGELVDLVNSFFGFFLEDKLFTFLGRSSFPSQTVTKEYYQIVLASTLRSAGESEINRGEGDASNKVHVNSFSLDLTTSMYLDREVLFPGTSTPYIIDGADLVEDIIEAT